MILSMNVFTNNVFNKDENDDVYNNHAEINIFLKTIDIFFNMEIESRERWSCKYFRNCLWWHFESLLVLSL